MEVRLIVSNTDEFVVEVIWEMQRGGGGGSYESEFYEELSLYGQMPAKILADVMPK